MKRLRSYKRADMDIDVFILLIGLIGTIAYAISGALVGIENKLDAFGVVVLSVITATGGGFLRDLILGNGQFTIFNEWWYPLIAFGVAVIVFLIMWFIRNLAWEDSKIYRLTYLFIDAIGLGTFVVVGGLRAQSSGVGQAGVVMFYSVITCVGGSVLRDVLVCRIPVIFRKHIYAIAAIIGASIYVGLCALHANVWVNFFATISVVVVIRFLAFHYKWNFPKIHLKNEEQ